MTPAGFFWSNRAALGVLARFASGAISTFESSRVAVGPRAEYVIEVYGTAGSVRRNFQRLNELEVCLGLGGENYGYPTVMADPSHGDFARFQPGAGISMGFDDVKTIEAQLFLESVTSGKQLCPVGGRWMVRRLRRRRRSGVRGRRRVA